MVYSNSNYNVADNWWQSTGFLYGQNPSLDVDDPMRISTNIPTFNPPYNIWQPLATGFFNIPGSVDGEPATAPQPQPLESGGLLSTPVRAEVVSLAKTNTPNFCKANCTLGGCSDPTTDVHDMCVAAGCCAPHPPTYTFSESTNVSQMAYGDADCIQGPELYCQSQYTYKQCNPGSVLNAWEDPKCFDTSYSNFSVPYYAVIN